MLAMREVREIYHQGVYAVAGAFRQLYEMIEVEDERVHRLVASANAAHLRKIEQFTARIQRLEEELAVKVRQVHRLNLAGMRCKDYFQARNFIECLSLSGDPEQALDELRLPLRIASC